MTDPRELARWRAEFPITRKAAYLNHAAVCAPPRRSVEAACELARSVAQRGEAGWSERNARAEEVRGQAARLIGARREQEVALVSNTSDGLGVVAAGLDWRRGDNVVGAEPEFPSNVYPWMGLGDRGVDYRRVPERAGRIDADELLAAMDERTRLVALSWVQYASGYRADLARIGAACRAAGALFVVDAIQGLGALQIDVERDHVDVLVAAAHKWLLGPEGIALLYVSDRVVESIRPSRYGWRSVKNQLAWTELALELADGARRYECGTLNFVGIVALGASLDLLLEVGMARIEARVLDLTDRLAVGLDGLGLEVVGRRWREESSGIVAAVRRDKPVGELVEALAERGIVVAARAGRLRVSPHFFNTEEEIDRLLQELGQIL